MAARSPIVRKGGRLQQLPAGDTLSGLPRMRVYLAGGDRSYIPLDENGELPIQLADGTPESLPMIGVSYA